MADRIGTTSPGWYPDPSGLPQNRYWDGAAWTDQVAGDRPWPAAPPKKRHRLRNTMLGLAALIFLIVVIAVASGSGSDKKTDTTTPAVSNGLGARNASGDVTGIQIEPVDQFGFVKGTVTVVNHSSKRSDYFIDVALQSSDGSVQQATTTAVLQNLEPGQTATTDIMFHPSSPTPDAKAVAKSVQRTASH